MVIQLIRRFRNLTRTQLTIMTHSQIENDETLETEYPNENDSEDTETNKTSAIPNFMLQILPVDEIAKGINSLNSKQNTVRTWAKNYVKYGGHDVEPMHMFLSRC